MKKPKSRARARVAPRRINAKAHATARKAMEQTSFGLALGPVVTTPKPQAEERIVWDVPAMVSARIVRANAVGELNEAQNDLIAEVRAAFDPDAAAITPPHRSPGVERAGRRVHEASRALQNAAAEHARVWRGAELYNLPPQVQIEIDTATRRARFEERKPNRRHRR